MKERLNTLMNLEGLSAAQFAALIGIQRSTLSNLLNGRNYPSYEIINSILTKCPNLNIEWFLKGSGVPHKNSKFNLRGEPMEKITSEFKREEKEKSEERKESREIDGDLFGFYSSEIEDAKREDAKREVETGTESETETEAENSPQTDIPEENEKNNTYHPFPPLEEGEIEKRVKMLQNSVNKNITEEIEAPQPSENLLKPNSFASVGKKTAKKEIKKVILLYSDGTFESFEQ